MDWRYRIQESYEAAQGWIVITIIGIAIGMNAAFLNIITEWLADIKLGHCKKAFYLNEDFCCWGEDKGKTANAVLSRRVGYSHALGCADWQRWTGFEPANYFVYIFFAVCYEPEAPQRSTPTDSRRLPLLRRRPPWSNHMPPTPLGRASPRSNASSPASS